MKKILTITVIFASSFKVSSQTADTNNFSIDSIESKKVLSIEERLSKQETAIRELKQENEILKNEFKNLKNPFSKNSRRLIISRRGSKQIMSE